MRPEAPWQRHDIFLNAANGRKAPVPRHAEIKETLVAQIRKQLGIESGPKRGAET
jgi:hypothetical protein